MENILKIKKIVLMVMIALLIFTISVYAVNNDSFKTTISVANTQVKRGDVITVTIGLRDIAIESGEKGIGAYTASINFDSSVLEYVKTDGTDKWEAPFYKDGLVTGNTKDGEVVKNNVSIGTITFKVKENAKLEKTTISLNNFSGSTAVTEVVAANVSIEITLIDNNNNSSNNNNQNNTNNNNNNNNHNNSNNGQNGVNNNNGQNSGNNNNNQNNGNNTSNNSTNSVNSNPNEVNNTSKGEKLPQAGETNNVGYNVETGKNILFSAMTFIKIMKIKY